MMTCILDEVLEPDCVSKSDVYYCSLTAVQETKYRAGGTNELKTVQQSQLRLGATTNELEAKYLQIGMSLTI